MNAIYSDYSPIFLYVDKYRFSKNWGYPGATVPYSLIRYVISGSCQLDRADKPDTDKRDFLFGCAGQYTSLRNVKDIVRPLRQRTD